MKPFARNFLTETSGAVTVDWVVLAAATVGLGLTAVATVRTGTTTLGNSIQTALSDASVAMVCEGGTPEYALLVFTGDAAGTADDISNHYAALTDEELLHEYEGMSRKTYDLHDAGENAVNVNEALDVTYLIAQEMANRGLAAPDGAQSFDDLNTAVTGAEGSSGCGSSEGGSGGTSGGYELLVLNTLDDGRIQASVLEEISHYGVDELWELVRNSENKYNEQASNGNLEDAAFQLDMLYTTYQELLSRDDVDLRMVEEGEALFNRAYEDYQHRLG